jgi:3-oxoacyl-[acyl-carrier protein] reductase
MLDTTDTKVVLITGAMSDIGQAAAKAFARLGYNIVLNYRHGTERAAAFADHLRLSENAPRTIAIRADVRARSEIHSLFEQAYQELGRVDVLINNAGINRDKPFLEMSDDEWDTVVTTILTGTFQCSQEFAQRYAGSSGNIINLGALTALKGRKNGANYCSARAAVLVLTKCMALELAPRIRVNTVTPGRIDTTELRARYQIDEPTNRSRLAKEVPLGRFGEADEVASMMTYLVTAGQYITGQNFLVDGGLFMH